MTVLSALQPDLLVTVAAGNLDLQAEAVAELAERGLGPDGKWVGYPSALTPPGEVTAPTTTKKKAKKKS